MKRTSDKFAITVLHMAFFLLLMFVYLSYIVVVFDYEGFIDDFNEAKMWASLPIVAILASTIRKHGSPSNFFLHMTLALIVTPTLVLYSGEDLPTEFTLLTVLSYLLIFTFVNLTQLRPIRFFSIDCRRFALELTIASVLFVLSIFAMGGGKYLNFDVTLVYELRDDAAKNLSDIYGYLAPIFAKVVIPFAIVFALVERRWGLIVILATCSIFIFGLTTHKAPIVFPFFVLGVYWIAHSRNMVRNFVATLLVLLLIATLDFWLAEETGDLVFGWFGNFYVERSLLIPSHLDSYYFDFFSNHTTYHWSQSKLTLGLLDKPYPMNPEKLIGQNYITSADNASPNIGWIGSGFANAGYVGTLIYSVLIGMFLSFLDAYGKKIGARMVIAFFTVPFVTMITSSDLTVMILTEGLIVAIPLLMSINPPATLESNVVVSGAVKI